MSSTPSKTSIIFAGEVFPLVRDLSGQVLQVRVRALPVRHLGKVLEACADEARLLELTCQRETPDLEWQPVDAAFVDNLADESHVVLVEAAKRLNFSRAASWGHRQIEAKEFQVPLLLKADQALSPVVEKMAHLLISSLRSSSSPDAPVTKS